MQLKPGDLVIAYFWKKNRPMLVFGVSDDKTYCILAPITSVIPYPRKMRRELRRGHTLRLRSAGDFEASTKQSFLKIACIHHHYKVNEIARWIGVLDAGQWITALIYYNLIQQQKRDHHNRTKEHYQRRYNGQSRTTSKAC